METKEALFRKEDDTSSMGLRHDIMHYSPEKDSHTGYIGLQSFTDKGFQHVKINPYMNDALKDRFSTHEHSAIAA